MTTLTLHADQVRGLLGPTLPFTALSEHPATDFIRLVSTGTSVYAVGWTGKSFVVARVDSDADPCDFLIYFEDAAQLLEHKEPRRVEFTPRGERLQIATSGPVSDDVESLTEVHTRSPKTFPSLSRLITVGLAGQGSAPIAVTTRDLQRIHAAAAALGPSTAMNLYPPANDRTAWVAAHQDRLLVVIAPTTGATTRGTAPNAGKARGLIRYADPLDHWPALAEGGVL